MGHPWLLGRRLQVELKSVGPEMAQGVKELASQWCKSDGLNSILGTHIKIEVRTGSAKLPFDFHIHRTANPNLFFFLMAKILNGSHNSLCLAWSISDFLYFAGYLLSSPWVGPEPPAPGDFPHVHWGQGDSGLFFWNTVCCNFGTELSQDTPKVLSAVWAFPIVELTPRDLPRKRSLGGRVFWLQL